MQVFELFVWLQVLPIQTTNHADLKTTAESGCEKTVVHGTPPKTIPDIGGWCPSHSISSKIHVRVGWVLPDRNSGWNVPRAPFTMHSWRTMAPLALAFLDGWKTTDGHQQFFLHCSMYPFFVFLVTLSKMGVYQQPKDLQKLKSCDVSLFFLCHGKTFPKNP